VRERGCAQEESRAESLFTMFTIVCVYCESTIDLALASCLLPSLSSPTMSPLSHILKPKSSRPNMHMEKKQTFKFQRCKLVAQTFNKLVYLKGDVYPKDTSLETLQDALINNLSVSHSGRTLAEILSLSYPEDLSTYKVERVVPGVGKEGTLVKFSRSEGEDKVIFSSLQTYFIANTYLCLPRISGGGWEC
jgi:hypothetical protein